MRTTGQKKQYAVARAEQRASRTRNSLCPSCGGSDLRGYIYCLACRQRNRRNIANRRESKTCTRCSTKVKREGNMCKPCKRKQRLQNKIRYYTMRRDGMCVSCCVRKAVYGYVLCKMCKEEKARRDKVRRERERERIDSLLSS